MNKSEEVEISVEELKEIMIEAANLIRTGLDFDITKAEIILRRTIIDINNGVF